MIKFYSHQLKYNTTLIRRKEQANTLGKYQ